MCKYFSFQLLDTDVSYFTAKSTVELCIVERKRSTQGTRSKILSLTGG